MRIIACIQLKDEPRYYTCAGLCFYVVIHLYIGEFFFQLSACVLSAYSTANDKFLPQTEFFFYKALVARFLYTVGSVK